MDIKAKYLIASVIVTMVELIIMMMLFAPQANSSEIPISPAPIIVMPTAPVVPALLQKIGFCESGNHQFNPDGSVKHGRVDTDDIGKYQINLRWQGARAKAMGYDFFTEAGNEAYAIWLFNADGSSPWSSSQFCWGT